MNKEGNFGDKNIDEPGSMSEMNKEENFGDKNIDELKPAGSMSGKETSTTEPRRSNEKGIEKTSRASTTEPRRSK